MLGTMGQAFGFGWLAPDWHACNFVTGKKVDNEKGGSAVYFACQKGGYLIGIIQSTPWSFKLMESCGPDDKQLEKAHAHCENTLGGKLLENPYPINSDGLKGTKYGFDSFGLYKYLGINQLLPIINLKNNAKNIVIDYDSNYRYPGEKFAYSDQGQYDYKKLEMVPQ
jgi:hypothetical protein